MGLEKYPNNAWNPQSNSILEQIHQVLADRLVIFDLEEALIDLKKFDLFEEYLSVVSYTIRSSYHQLHGHLSTQLVFGRDMSSPVPVDIDWNAIKNTRENSKRFPHMYSEGDYITLKKSASYKSYQYHKKDPTKL